MVVKTKTTLYKDYLIKLLKAPFQGNTKINRIYSF